MFIWFIALVKDRVMGVIIVVILNMYNSAQIVYPRLHREDVIV